MATYTIVPDHLGPGQQVAKITSVAVGDRINIVEVLGRPARKLLFYTTDSADIVQYRLNNRQTFLENNRPSFTNNTLTAWGLHGKTESVVWNATDVFTSEGEIIETGDGLNIASIEITSLTLSTGTTIEIVVW